MPNDATKPTPTVQHGDDSVALLVGLLVSNHTPQELALGYLRYEAVRRTNPRTFGDIHRLNLSGRLFDDLVDEAIKTWKEPNNEVPNE